MRLYTRLLLLLCFVVFLTIAQFAQAVGVTYELIAPSGTLTRGQDVTFTINMDTQGTSVSNAQVGLSYQTQYLQYVSATPGDATTSVDVSNQGDGKLVFTGSNPTGFKGKGTFANVTFKLIADSPGSTELCTLFAPSSPTATPAPGNPTPTTRLPTSIPRTGETTFGNTIAVMGLVCIIAAVGFFTLKAT